MASVPSQILNCKLRISWISFLVVPFAELSLNIVNSLTTMRGKTPARPSMAATPSAKVS